VSTPLTGDRRTGTPHAMPHWLIRLLGIVHLAGYRLTGGRLGLSWPGGVAAAVAAARDIGVGHLAQPKR